ncbi:murein hydrolase activator EnvC [Bacteriovorax sp. Seq25_V]|uniref:murein hydrolase activator EnvC family protein n=1 Tax=Bacteriovorax sp. Seq25_V TaxID=1201288 RepID=UPI000389ED69|nr:M23 family metallopeptidase [Bacteriovorax sp. Seq25_V]EQC45701.1 peptidase, M23 family [Bacteriovorax sp. Seq25_V]
MKSKLLLTSILFCSAFAATRTDYQNVIKEVNGLKTNIQKIETSLTTKNAEYLKVVSQRQKIDIEIYELEKIIRNNILVLEAKRNELSLKMRSLLLNSIEKGDGSSLLEKKILLARVRKDKKEIELQLKVERETQKKLTEQKVKYTEKVNLERELYTLVSELERKKSDYVQKYMASKENAEKLKEEIHEIQQSVAKAKVKKSTPTTVAELNADFLMPIEEFISKDYDKKGITFAVKTVSDIKASKAGQIVYTGALANYGNVVMIDHGNDVRSIYLGDLSPQVKKGDKVSSAQVIAKTRRSIRKEAIGKVYFEIRNKNKVQNTIKLVMNEKTQV